MAPAESCCCDWWRIAPDDVAARGESAGGCSSPLIDDIGYVNGLDTALVPLLDGLVHNISCSWLFDGGGGTTRKNDLEAATETPPGILLEFDFNILD